MDSDNLVAANWVDTAQSDNLVSNEGVDIVHQNGVHKPIPDNRGNGALGDVNGSENKVTMSLGPIDSVDNALSLDDSAANDSFIGKIVEGSNEYRGSNEFSSSKEGEMGDADHPQQTEPPDDPQKGKADKTLSDAQKVSSTWVKKGKNGEDGQSTMVNGSVSHSTPEQPVKSKSFHEKQTQVHKKSEKYDTTSTEGLEKAKTKPSKKNPGVSADEDTQSSLPAARDTKPRRVGVLPNYGFSFNCDLRAEKRKEFNSKLEEKIHAKEVERTNLQAKSKETQEAEIKKLRKSLNFKATPLPRFYQEPTPPKVELKKIPTTRPRSPKLGRRTSSSPATFDESSLPSSQLSRLSLDDKMYRNNHAKGLSPVSPKKPHRNSLPKLPSEKTNVHATDNKRAGPSKPTAGRKNEDNSHPEGEDAVPKTEASEVEPEADDKPSVEVETGLDSVPEPMVQ